MFNIISRQGETNQTHNITALHAHQMAIIKDR